MKTFEFYPFAQYFFGLGNVVGGALSMAGSMAATEKNIQSQKEINERNIAKQDEWNNTAREWALEDRAHEEGYNHPMMQRKRLEQAGLNAGLMYGNGASGGSTSIASTSPTAARAEAPRHENSLAALGAGLAGSGDGINQGLQMKLANDRLEMDKVNSEIRNLGQQANTLFKLQQYDEAKATAGLRHDAFRLKNDMMRTNMTDTLVRTMMKREELADFIDKRPLLKRKLQGEVNLNAARTRNSTADTFFKTVKSSYYGREANARIGLQNAQRKNIGYERMPWSTRPGLSFGFDSEGFWNNANWFKGVIPFSR